METPGWRAGLSLRPALQTERAAGAQGPGTHLDVQRVSQERELPQDAAAQALALPVNMTTLASAPHGPRGISGQVPDLSPELLGGWAVSRRPQLLLQEGQGPDTTHGLGQGTVRWVQASSHL